MDRPKSNTVLAMVRDENGRLVFAGDRLMSWGFHKSQRTPTPKVVKRGHYLLAGTGLCSVIDEILIIMDLPNAPKKGLRKFMASDFISAVHKHMVKQGLASKDRRALYGDKEKSADVDTLKAVVVIGVHGQLFELMLGSDSITIIELSLPYAHGCGGSLAWGALLATEGLDLTVEDRLTRAIRAAGTVSPGCNTEVDIIYEGA